MQGSEHPTRFFRVLTATIVAARRSPRSASLTGCPHHKDSTSRIGYAHSVVILILVAVRKDGGLHYGGSTAEDERAA
jgi:hypothetical protein